MNISLLSMITLILSLASGLSAQSSPIPADTATIQAPVCPIIDSLRLAKKPAQIKALQEQSFSVAMSSPECLPLLNKSLGEKSKPWAKIRKALPESQPGAMLQFYGIKKLTPDEQKRIFFSKSLQDSSTCISLADSIGLDALGGKDWMAKTTPWDTSEFSCKHALTARILPLIEALADTAKLRDKLLAVYPDIWYDRFGETSSDLEKVRYALNPSLQDSTHCALADYANAEQLMKYGTPPNGCASYVKERYGAPLLRMNFHKNYKPATLALINKRLGAVNPATLDSVKGILDTIQVLLGDGESMEVLDSLEASVLRLLERNPQALQLFKDPTGPMMLVAFNSQLTLMCNYPEITDRMLIKLFNDRMSDEKPLPSAEEIQALSNCLKPELISIITRLLSQFQPN